MRIKNFIGWTMTRCLFVLAAILSAPLLAADGVPLPKTSATTDVSDLWWNPAESGWGMQLVQAHDFVFATLFVYAADGKPTWVVAELQHVGGVVFTGPLYVTTGPYFGGAFNPGAVTTRQAGTMTFASQSVSTGQVSYSVDGVSVIKQVQRQTLVADNYNGSYVVAVNFRQSGCFNPAIDGEGSGALAISVAQTPANMSMVWVFPDSSTCAYSGSYDQSGRFGTFNGPFSCSTGEVGTMTFFEMTNRIGMLSGRLQGHSTTFGCSYGGRFTGIDPAIQ